MIAPGVLAQQQLLIPAGGVTPLPGPEQTVDFVVGVYLNQTNAASSRSLVMPSSVQEGDFMLTTIYHSGFVTTPAGWALFTRLQLPASSTFISVYFKVAVTADSGASLTWTQNVSANFTVFYTVFRGSQPLHIIDSNSSLSNASPETNLPLPQASPTNKGQYLVTVVGRLSATTDFPATAAFGSGWDMKSTASETSLPIRYALAIKEAVNVGDTAGTVTMTPPPGSPSQAMIQIVVGYAISGPPAIGHYWGGQGGWYAGEYVLGGSTYYLIDGGKASEPTSNVQAKTANTSTTGTDSATNGVANTDAMIAAGAAAHPAANHCRSWIGGGFTNWYMPSTSELQLIRDNLWQGVAGVSPGYSATGDQRYSAVQYWSSQQNGTAQYAINVSTNQTLNNVSKTNTRVVRPIRRVLKP